jgi:hypothetical protein
MAYTLGDYLIQARMTSTSGLPEDVVINDFALHFVAPPSTPELEEAMNIVGEFYRQGATAADRVGSYIGSGVDRGATHELAAYQIVSGPLGSPVLTVDWLGPVAPLTAENLPLEVAACLSFHGTLTGVMEEELDGDRPRARRRGRIYVGPLTTDAVDVTQFQPKLTAAFTAALRSNATNLADALQAATQPAEWSVWSRRDVVLHEVVGGWTDNAPDTQRRRGQAPSSRTVFTI